MSRYYLSLFLLLAVFIALGACTRTEDLEPLPQNRILEYKVANMADTVIYGAIDHTDHTITVYVPFYYGLKVIDPEISVSPGARIKEEIMPVEIGADGATYTVEGPDGSSSVYTLRIVMQHIPSLAVEWAQPGPQGYPTDYLPPVTGNFLSTNTAQAMVWLKPAGGGDSIRLDPTATGGSIYIDAGRDGAYMLNAGKLPADIDTGYYNVSVHFMGHYAALPEPVHVVHRQPDLLLSSQVAKQGGTISYYAYNSIFLDLESVEVTVNGNTYTLPVQQYDRVSMRLKIPDDFPPGEYNYTAQFSFAFKGWATVRKTGYLRVTAR